MRRLQKAPIASSRAAPRISSRAVRYQGKRPGQGRTQRPRARRLAQKPVGFPPSRKIVGEVTRSGW